MASVYLWSASYLRTWKSTNHHRLAFADSIRPDTLWSAKAHSILRQANKKLSKGLLDILLSIYTKSLPQLAFKFKSYHHEESKKEISMKLLYLMPGTGMPEDEIERRTDVANSITRYGTAVTVKEVGQGPLSIESTIESDISVGPMLEKLLEIRSEGSYDAVIIGCAGDPGLAAARELMDIPVIGPAESSYHFACMIADRFSIMTPLTAGKASDSRVRARLREMGLEGRLASVVFSQTSIAEMWGKNKDVIISELSVGVEDARRKGAGCVVLGCMSMAFLLIDEVVGTRDVPIVNPLKTAIKTAEMFVDLGSLHSRMTYPAADFDKLRRTIFSDK